MKLCKQIRSPDDAVALQTDLENLCIWSDTWKLKLNPAKCKVITFTLRKKNKSWRHIPFTTSIYIAYRKCETWVLF